MHTTVPLNIEIWVKVLARNLTKVRNLYLDFVRAGLTESHLNWVLVIMGSTS